MDTTPAQLDANRANSLLSTGPRTPEGQLASSANARSHGLTTRLALLPGEDADEYHAYHQDYFHRYQPSNPLDHDLVIELADLKWRLRRVAAFESQLLSNEMLALTTDPALAPLIERFDAQSQILALAFTRLVQSKVLTSLLTLESRLARRADKIRNRLEVSLQERFHRPLHAPTPAPNIENAQNEANPVAPPPAPPQPIRVEKFGRNEACPCRSGLKYKRCCLGKPARTTAAAA